MKCKKYDDLIKDLKFENSKETMQTLNERIEEAIAGVEEPMLYYEELICYLKKEESLSEAYTLVSIGYAILIGITSAISNELGKEFIIGLLIACILVGIAGMRSLKQGRRCGFVLNLLMLRYEKIKDEVK